MTEGGMFLFIYGVLGLITGISCVLISYDDEIYHTKNGEFISYRNKINSCTVVFFRAFILWPIIVFMAAGLLCLTLKDKLRNKK